MVCNLELLARKNSAEVSILTKHGMQLVVALEDLGFEVVSILTKHGMQHTKEYEPDDEITSQSLLSMVCNNEVMRFSVLHLQLSYQNISKMLSFSYENWLFSYL